MLTTAIVFGVLASIVGGWSFMCDAIPEVERPRLAHSELPLLLAIVLGLIAIVLLFFLKWYVGLMGLPALVLGFNVFAGIWNSIYRVLKL